MSRSQAFPAGFASFRPIPETPSEQALCGFGASAVPARFCRSHESWHPCGTHGSDLGTAGCVNFVNRVE